MKKMCFADWTGHGVRIAVVDSGIDLSHEKVGWVAGGVNLSLGASDEIADCVGHGTACAGIIRWKAPEAAIFSQVKEVIVRTLKLEIAPDEIPEDEMLFGEGENNMSIDSIATLEVICALEEEFGIEIEDDNLNVELFASIALIVNYIESKLNDTRDSSPYLKAAILPSFF